MSSSSILLDPAVTRGAFAILSWYATNIFTVILNKYLFQMISFTFPLTLTAIHMFICSIGSILVLRIFKIVPFVNVPRHNVISHLVPLAAIFCVNIILGNVSLRWIPVSFMQTIKSLVPFFTVLIQGLVLHQYSPRIIYYSLIPVVGGVALASFTELNFEMTGFLTAMFASVTTAVQSIVSGMLLTGSLKLDSVNLVYYMAPISFMMILPMAILAEGTAVSAYEFEAYGSGFVLINLIVSGCVAYLLNICTFFAIKSTTPLTFTVFGNLKVVVVIVVSVLIFRNEITIWNGLGCFIAIVGILWYNSIEYRIKEEKKRLASLNAESNKDMEVSIPLKESVDNDEGIVMSVVASDDKTI
eukprot:TRINITY_DN1710_c0_g1_i1.p1 TRINITY_DN1710_c0_g1~~TRINITY_DN1710_c0_g1_i1.p1  ORF type:complete len:357 (+),score=57.94 TRINITY_DN1710_c0_g1_i1:264-1334(+)